MYLGNDYEDKKLGRVIAYNGDGHMLTIGPTRSGKSRRLLIPNLLYETGRSMLVVDMKGELAATTAPHRMSKADYVGALDPFGVLPARGVDVPGIGFNPMLKLDPASDEFVDDAMGLAEALVQVKPGDQDPHWAESAQDLVAALIMLVRCVWGDKATLGIVREKISSSPADLESIAKMAIEKAIHPAISNKLSKYTNIGADNKELASIMSNAQTQTRFLDSPGIARNLEAQGVESIDFGVLKSHNVTIYLVLPPERLVTHAKWLRLVISSAMTAMQRTLKIQGRPDVLFMLDEFPQLGRMESIESAVSLNAGYGVKVWAAVQHLGQLKQHYGENWETFLSAGCVTASAPRDVLTRDHLTSMIGTGTKTVRSTSHNSDGGTNVSTSVQKDDLVSPHEWRQMVMGEQFAFIPTVKGQVIKRIYGDDFTELPEVKSGAIKLGNG
ncbi:MAG: type IV secretory system conjugative DNA transfer family protein [Beijerinckiaceae bacterium]